LNYVAGVDGGGTKTAVTIADMKGKAVHTFTSGAINYNGQDEASVRSSLREIFATIARVCGGLDRCVQVCIGAAGVSNPTVIPRLEASIRESGYEGGLTITGDQETALCGAHGKAVGVILIAGTGSICYGQNEAGLSHRAGGCGHLIDDEGSGYSIGRELLSAVVRAHDGRIPATPIAGMVYRQLQLDSVQQLIRFVYDQRTNKKDIAALAPILSQACALGDKTALSIADKSARSLCELVVPVAEKLGLHAGTVAMAGSVLLKNSEIRNRLTALLGERYPGMRCIAAEKDAAYGAVLLALGKLAAG